MLQYPEQPATDDDAAGKPDKTFDPVAELGTHILFLGYAKDNRGKEGEQQGGAKMREFQGFHDFFPMAMWCASTALIIFNSPATIMNFVP